MRNYDTLKDALDLMIWTMMEQDPKYWVEASPKQVGALVALMTKGLEDPSRENRLRVLSVLVGRSVGSTRYLYCWEAHCLIEFLKDPYATQWRLSDDGITLLAGAEGYARFASLVHAAGGNEGVHLHPASLAGQVPLSGL